VQPPAGPAADSNAARATTPVTPVAALPQAAPRAGVPQAAVPLRSTSPAAASAAHPSPHRATAADAQAGEAATASFAAPPQRAAVPSELHGTGPSRKPFSHESILSLPEPTWSVSGRDDSGTASDAALEGWVRRTGPVEHSVGRRPLPPRLRAQSAVAGMAEVNARQMPQVRRPAPHVPEFEDRLPPATAAPAVLSPAVPPAVARRRRDRSREVHTAVWPGQPAVPMQRGQALPIEQPLPAPQRATRAMPASMAADVLRRQRVELARRLAAAVERASEAPHDASESVGEAELRHAGRHEEEVTAAAAPGPATETGRVDVGVGVSLTAAVMRD
jgi:hypothetical protein